MSSEELSEWQALYRIKHEEAEIAEHGEVIYHGRDEPDDDDEEEDEADDAD